MVELIPDNTLEYLRAKGWIGAGPAQVETLSGGVSNQVMRVQAGENTFVLKQSRPQLRTRVAWFSDLERVYRELEVMQAFGPILPEETVPQILFVDRANFVYAMSHAPLPFVVWKESLLAGQTDQATGAEVGRVLGRMHEGAARQAHRFSAFADSRVFDQLRIDPFYRRIRDKHPEVAIALDDLIEQMLTRRESLCHGDYTPKNMLVHARGFMLVDYETAYFGDPAMDLGLFLAHLLLKAVRRPLWRDRYFALTSVFWASYGREITFHPLADLQARGIAHLGACLLARIDGTSPVDYLAEEAKREAVRRLGRILLQDKVKIWEQVLALVDQTVERV